MFIFILQCFSMMAVAQGIAEDTIGCKSIKNIKFNAGVDTLEFSALYSSFISGEQDPRLQILARKKEILIDDYQDKNHQSTYVEFMLPNCDKRFMGILDRKIYDKTFIRKHIGDFQTEFEDLNNLKTYQKINIKCVFFEGKDIKDGQDNYFFTIIELRPL